MTPCHWVITTCPKSTPNIHHCTLVKKMFKYIPNLQDLRILKTLHVVLLSNTLELGSLLHAINVKLGVGGIQKILCN